MEGLSVKKSPVITMAGSGRHWPLPQQVKWASSSQSEKYFTVPALCSCKVFLTLILLQHNDRQPVLCVLSINNYAGQQRLIDWCPCSAGSPRNRLQLLCLGCLWSQAVWDPMEHFWRSSGWSLCSPYLGRGMLGSPLLQT